MNLTYLTKTDKELQAMRELQSQAGKLARKEIQRRKMVGYWDGTMKVVVDAKAEIVEVESTVGQVTIIKPTVRKVEKKMAGRGR
jgi:hypothetical protein